MPTLLLGTLRALLETLARSLRGVGLEPARRGCGRLRCACNAIALALALPAVVAPAPLAALAKAHEAALGLAVALLAREAREPALV
jgi:hypothetical protein